MHGNAAWERLVAEVKRPFWVSELDLADRPPLIIASSPPTHGGSVPASHYERARLLIRLQGEPLGLITADLTEGEADVDAVVTEATGMFRSAIEAQLGADWQRQLTGRIPLLSGDLAAVAATALPGVSVVIGTRNRPDHVVTCVAGVLKQAYAGAFEVIVVDNGSATGATGDVIRAEFGQDRRVRYIHERSLGLSRARNIGLNAARFPITAFLSDDIRVDPHWMVAVVRGFRRAPDVRCVVGYCPPLYLDNEAQLVFERSMAWGWRNGFQPRLVGRATATDRLYPYRIGLGIGANMSFETTWFQAMGGFDQALGPGTRARGGEDLDAQARVLLADQQCAYEPAALGWHADRYDDRSFVTHMFTYGAGLTAFLASHLADPRTRWQVLKRMPLGARYLLAPEMSSDPQSRLGAVKVGFAHRLASAAGRLAGPYLYARSRLALRQLGPVRVGPPATTSPERVQNRRSV